VSPLAEWIDMLSPATARARTVDADPSSPTYGNETPGPDFPVGYQKASSHELNRMGAEYTENVYLILADLDAGGNPPVGQHDTLNVDGLGDLDVRGVTPYEQPDQRMVRIEAEAR
jgi:hypothetical protein